VTSPICSRDIDFEVYSLVLKVLKQSVVCREPMPLLPFKRGIQVIYIVRLKRSSRHLAKCHGLDKLWKWNVVCFGMFVMNDGALMAVKKLYIRLCAARDTKVRNCLAWLNSYKYIRLLSFKLLYNIRLACIIEKASLVRLCLYQFPVYWMRAN
jgi:hypothetical protein